MPESIIAALYKNAHKALKPGGRLLVHDFMVNDSLDGPGLGALWAQLQALPFEAPFLTEAAAYLGDAADFLRQLFS